jgi:hypothetical protein
MAYIKLYSSCFCVGNYACQPIMSYHILLEHFFCPCMGWSKTCLSSCVMSIIIIIIIWVGWDWVPWYCGRKLPITLDPDDRWVWSVDGLIIFFSIALPAHSGLWPLIQFLNHFSQTVGLLGRVISSSQSYYLNTGQHKHRINAYTHQTSMP